MAPSDYEIAQEFKRMLAERGVPALEIIVYGSRARGDARPDSDLDIMVVVEEKTHEISKQVSYCAWAVGFERGILIQSSVKQRRDIEEGPASVSTFIRNVRNEGVRI